jgi:hypothetical protein
MGMKLSSVNDGPSEHLFWSELDCKDGTRYPDEFVLDGRATQLAIVFEKIRLLCSNKRLTVSSAYRTPEWNRKIGGAKYSQHLYGRALDIAPPKGMIVDEFYKLIWSNVYSLDITGLGRYITFVHVDIRPTDRLYCWSGTGIKDS